MKKTILLICIIATSLPTLAKDKKLKTKITDVTVFLNGAQVTREGSTTIPAGKSTLKFDGVTPLLRRESIQVQGEGDFTILSINYHMDLIQHERPDSEIKALEAQVKTRNERIEEITASMSILLDEQKMIATLNNAALQHKEVNVDQISQAREIIHNDLGAIKLAYIKYNRELTALKEKNNAASQKILALGAPQSTAISQVLVMVSAKREVKAKLGLSYYVTSARWYPSYDLRVKDVSSNLIIDYKANVSQQTGEDWSNVKLTLSTSNPNQSGQRPKLMKWDLRLNQNNPNKPTNNYDRFAGHQYAKVNGQVLDATGEALPFATIQVVGSTVGATTNLNGQFELTLPPNARQLRVNFIGYTQKIVTINNQRLTIQLAEDAVMLESVVVMSYSSGLITRNMPQSLSSSIAVKREDIARLPSRRARTLTSTYIAPVVIKSQNVVDVDFEIEELYNIPSDAKSYSVIIDQISTPAHYQYYCAPKMDKDAFLTAQVLDWTDYNLLEGQANIFFEGKYIGTSLMDVGYISDTLDISLGRDRGVQVTRTKAKDVTKKTAFGTQIREVRSWELLVKHNKAESLNIILEDQFPTTRDESITIKQQELGGGNVDEHTGIISWNLTVESNKTEEVSFMYGVWYPKASFIDLD